MSQVDGGPTNFVLVGKIHGRGPKSAPELSIRDFSQAFLAPVLHETKRGSCIGHVRSGVHLDLTLFFYLPNSRLNVSAGLPSPVLDA
jgi:hypothetical protein